MPYILRNKEGQIKSFHQEQPSPEAELMVPENYQEIIDFLKIANSIDELQQVLSSSDAGIVRVLEDVIDLLCKNHAITFTDLPASAQKKLTIRKKIRAEISGIENLITDENDSIF
jgi:hypothetical protein